MAGHELAIRVSIARLGVPEDVAFRSVDTFVLLVPVFRHQWSRLEQVPDDRVDLVVGQA